MSNVKTETVTVPKGQRPKGRGFGLKSAGAQTGKKFDVYERKVKKVKMGMKDGGLAEAIEKVKAKEMETGGEAVPKKFKGFSKLPEAVQEKMDPTLAKKFEDGGPVKMGSGGGVCRGMGIARAGGKFKLR